MIPSACQTFRERVRARVPERPSVCTSVRMSVRLSDATRCGDVVDRTLALCVKYRNKNTRSQTARCLFRVPLSFATQTHGRALNDGHTMCSRDTCARARASLLLLYRAMPPTQTRALATASNRNANVCTCHGHVDNSIPRARARIALGLSLVSRFGFSAGAETPLGLEE